MKNETLEAKLRNQLSPIYSLADMILLIDEKPEVKKILIEQAKQAVKNKEVIDLLLVEIEKKILYKPDISGSLPLNEQSLIKWGFKIAGDGSFDRELNGVRITLEYQVRFNNKIICDAPNTENQFEALFYGLTGLKLSSNLG